MENCRFTTLDWVRYLRSELPTPEMKAMSDILAHSEETRAELYGLELLIKDEGLSLQDDLELIVAALEHQENESRARMLKTLEKIEAEENLIYELNHLSLLDELDSCSEASEGHSSFSASEQLAQGQASEAQRLEQLLFKAVGAIREEISQAKAAILKKVEANSNRLNKLPAPPQKVARAESRRRRQASLPGKNRSQDTGQLPLFEGPTNKKSARPGSRLR